MDVTTSPDAGASADAGTGGHAASMDLPAAERAWIGDELRLPIAWCELGTCISRYQHPHALGEADIRARAVESGWRVDALGRLVCPDCQQSSSSFWATRPVTLWDRTRALSRAARMATLPNGDAAARGTASAQAGRVPPSTPAQYPPAARGRPW